MNNVMESVRTDVLNLLAQLLAGWKVGAPLSIASVFEPSAILISSAHGTLQGAASIAEVLALDVPKEYDAHMESTNHYVGVDGDVAVLGAYLYGQIANSQGSQMPLLFGAQLVGELESCDRGWWFTRLQLNLIWLEGNRDLIVEWNPPRPRRFWEVGDKAPHFVNELDSPWARLPGAVVAGSAQDEVAEVFMRYIWAMDQADFGQMRETLAEDIAGAFPPIGDLKGRHEVMGQLKDFRQSWPWMQHFCVPLNVVIDGDKAQMSLGRVIAQRPFTEEGLPLYGAHYRIELRQENACWRIFWFEYIEGWIAGPSKA